MIKRSCKSKPYLPASDQFDIELFPFYWVARVNAIYAREMDKVLKRLDIDASRWRVAMLLRVHGKLSISELTEHAIAKMPTITKTVYRMRDEGLVSINQSEHDGRVMIVALSSEGHSKVSLVRERTEGLFESAFQGMTDAQIARLTKLLHQFCDNLSN